MFKKFFNFLPATIQTSLLIFYQAHKIIIRLIIIDQLSKWWFIEQLSNNNGQAINITSFFQLVYAWNYGISFGLFSDYSHYSNILFLLLNSVIVIYLYKLLMQAINTKSFIGYSWIIGGAIGNLCDRIIKGAVFDFIFFHYGENIWFPAFNIADSCIFIGVVIIIYDVYYSKKTVEPNTKNFYDVLEEKADLIKLADDIKIKQSNNKINGK